MIVSLPTYRILLEYSTLGRVCAQMCSDPRSDHIFLRKVSIKMRLMTRRILDVDPTLTCCDNNCE